MEVMRENGSAITAAAAVVGGAGWIVGRVVALQEAVVKERELREKDVKAERELREKEVQLAGAKASQQIAEARAALHENLLKYIATDDYRPLQETIVKGGRK